MQQPTRLDKITVIKANAFVAAKFDLFKLDPEPLDKLYDIASKQTRGFSLGVEDLRVINQLASEHRTKTTKPIGQFSCESVKPTNKAPAPARTKKETPIGKWNTKIS